MKMWTSILVAGAILAFAVPTAFAAISQIPPDPVTGPGPIVKPTPGALKPLHGGTLVAQLNAQIKALTKKQKALAAKNHALVAENLAQAASIGNLNSQIWTLTHPGLQPTAVTTNPDQDCIDYQLCTPEQNCRYWGNQCDLANPPASGDPAKETPAPDATAAN